MLLSVQRKGAVIVYAVQAFLAFRNATRRDAISQNIETRLGQSVTWGEVERTDRVSADGFPAVLLTVRFQTKSEADSFWADVLAAVGTGLSGPVTGSAIWRHDCPHDQQAPAPCVVSERQDW